MIDTIVDLNHNDDVASWSQAANAGVVAVIHKASQGLTFTDPAYPTRRLDVAREGLLWGAYHFATGTDGTHQADHFLASVIPDKDTFVALDLERNPDGPTVNLNQARDFIRRIRHALNRLPWGYGSDVLAELAAQELRAYPDDPLLSLCPLWIARYSTNPPILPPGFKRWLLWQYLAGENAGAHDALPGLGRVDRSRFNGDLAALKKVWAT